MTWDKQRQQERAKHFRDLHGGDQLLQLANVWDATSARVAEAAGATAIGTTSFGVALDNGITDGERIPWSTVCDVVGAIVAAVEIPVSIDIEAGRGTTAVDVGNFVEQIISIGAVGVNIEDSVPGQPGTLRAVDEQAERLAAARDAADASGIPLFVNARCDVYFGATIAPENRLAELLSRAKDYAAGGADGLFVPGLVDLDVLRQVTGSVDLPVNVMVGVGSPSAAELAAAGARRTSQGGEPFVAVVGMFKQLVDSYLAGSFGSPLDALGAGAPLIGTLAR